MTASTTNLSDGYESHYKHGRSVPDWKAAEAAPERFGMKAPWLPADRNARILDLGCGWGSALLSLWAAGYRNVEGIELSPDVAETARAAAGGRVTIHSGDGADLLQRNAGAYDVITLFSVLEHMPTADGLRLLQLCRGALRENGIVVVQVPNMSALFAAHLLYNDLTHLAGHTELSLRHLLQRAGFEAPVFIPDDWNWQPGTWRPWAPWRGLGIRGLVNHVIHKLLYWARGDPNPPSRYGFNLNLYARRARWA